MFSSTLLAILSSASLTLAEEIIITSESSSSGPSHGWVYDNDIAMCVVEKTESGAPLESGNCPKPEDGPVCVGGSSVRPESRSGVDVVCPAGARVAFGMASQSCCNVTIEGYFDEEVYTIAASEGKKACPNGEFLVPSKAEVKAADPSGPPIVPSAKALISTNCGRLDCGAYVGPAGNPISCQRLNPGLVACCSQEPILVKLEE